MQSQKPVTPETAGIVEATPYELAYVVVRNRNKKERISLLSRLAKGATILSAVSTWRAVHYVLLVPGKAPLPQPQIMASAPPQSPVETPVVAADPEAIEDLTQNGLS